MKHINLVLFFLYFIGSIFAQEEQAVNTVVLNYARSYYTGDFEKAASSIHPDISKSQATISEISGNAVINHFSYSSIIETVRSRKPDGEAVIPEIKIDVLKIEDNYSNVAISTPDFFDFLLMVKINEEWKIINVISGTDIRSSNADKNEIYKAVEMYKEGVLGGDAMRLEMSILPGFSRAQIQVDNNTAKARINRVGFESAMEMSLNKTGILEDVMRDYDIEILASNEKLATVRLGMPFSIEYLQLFNSGTGWKIFNSMRRGNPGYSFYQNSPVYLGEEIPDFTLPIYKGGEFAASKNKGKKTLLIFLRGWIGQIWCPLCQYQYLELAELDKQYNWREKYNLDIYFVLPYSEERIDDWFTSFKRSADIINGWRNLEAAPDFTNFVNKYYPINFELKEDEKVPVTFPVLLDADRKVSKRFKLFTSFWDGVKAEQNVSTIYLLDEEGIVQFKYFSQQTQDRPTYEYIMKLVEWMN